MVSATLVDAVRVPDVPVMVTVEGPEVTAAEVLAVSVTTWVPAADPGANEVVTPLGMPVAESVTDPEKPPTAVMVMVLVALPPCATEIDPGEDDSVKPGSGFTMTVAEPVTVL
jgi:hypothetical protein